MNDKVRPINQSIEKWNVNKKRGSLSEAVSESSIDFKDNNQGIEVLAFAAAIRALGLSNRDLQPRKLSNYIRSVSYTHLRAHETREDRVWRGLG